MPGHKRQHFVPRCALKPFSLDQHGRAINVFNIKAERSIRSAPVKGQCARDYLYAKEDLSAERLLSQMEGHYARITGLLSNGKVLSGEDVERLKFLILIQMRRTEWAIQQIREAAKSMSDAMFA